VCDLETSRMGAPYIYDISRLRVKMGNIQCMVNTGHYNVNTDCNFHLTYY